MVALIATAAHSIDPSARIEARWTEQLDYEEWNPEVHTIHLPSLAALAFLAFPAHSQCEIQMLTASDAELGDRFGYAVDLQGARAVVGAPWESSLGQQAGAAYVYERGPSGWIQVAKLLGSDVSTRDVFGVSVAVSGNTILIGAPWTGSGIPRPGAVYVFDRIGSAWVETAKLMATGGTNDQHFGSSVDLEGDTAVIGAPFGDAFTGTGAVYVFQRTGSVWSQVEKLTPSDGSPGDYFGYDVSLSGYLILIGTPWQESRRGSAYLFSFDDSLGWFQVQKLLPADPELGKLFGVSVSLSGELVTVGASGDDSGNSGAVYVFEKGLFGWDQTTRLVAPDGSIPHSFGFDVTLDGNSLVVGDPYAAGGGYLFIREASGWRFAAKVMSRGPAAGDDFGNAVAIDGSLILVGTEQDDGIGQDSGSAEFFELVTSAVSYCFGMGCSCANEDPVAGCANSTLLIGLFPQGGLLAACGTESVSSDDLVLRLFQLPVNQFGIVYMGGAPIQLPFGDGFQCVGAGGLGIFRYDPPQSSGASGIIDLGPGIVARSQSFAANGHIDAGETWYFQGWYRDPMGPCGTAFNLSNALAVTFAP